MREKISPIIQSVGPISVKSEAKILDLIEIHHFKKGDLIAVLGQKNNQEYFIVDGICKSFLTTPEGEDITISFFMAGSIMSPSTTRNRAGRSIINIQALTHTYLAAMDASAFEKLMVADLEVRDFGNSVLRNELMAKVQKEMAMASLKAKDRLVLLRKHYPNIENQIPHPDIASYLGITTISLSRLRSQS